ncbi:MAG: fibronectin type III domain-containing protein [bacterium]
MKNILLKIYLILLVAFVLLMPKNIHAEGITARGGGDKTVGETFIIEVIAEGTNFDAITGSISITGPVETILFSPGNAIWMPGRIPQNNTLFAGITEPTNSLMATTITLKAIATGAGSINIKNAKLAYRGELVSNKSKSTEFFIKKNSNLPNAPIITSSSHPDQEKTYDLHKIDLSWQKDKGVLGYSYTLDNDENTTPETKSISANNTITFADKTPGTYYFHVRAVNADGWGETASFKITITDSVLTTQNSSQNPEVLGATVGKKWLGLNIGMLPIFSLIVGVIMIFSLITLVIVFGKRKNDWI